MSPAAHAKQPPADALFQSRLPEQRLWGAVLAQGVREALKGEKEAVRWIMRAAAEHEVGSAMWVCAVLDMNYLEVIREILKMGTPEQKKKLIAALA